MAGQTVGYIRIRGTDRVRHSGPDALPPRSHRPFIITGEALVATALAP